MGGEGKVVVVTGASDGIGKEIALRYSKRPSCSLVLIARTREKLLDVEAACKKNGCTSSLCIPIDVSCESDCKKMVETVIEKFHKIDILVLCAGVSYHNTFEQSNLAAFRRMMEVNYYGYLYCTYYALPHLKDRKGQVVVLSSVSAEMGLPLRTGYCASKFAVNGLFDALKYETGGVVHITMIVPASVNTNMRLHSAELGKADVKFHEDESARTSVETCVDIVMDAADKRKDRVVFPFSSRAAILLKPWVPGIISKIVLKKAGGNIAPAAATTATHIAPKL